MLLVRGGSTEGVVSFLYRSQTCLLVYWTSCQVQQPRRHAVPQFRQSSARWVQGVTELDRAQRALGDIVRVVDRGVDRWSPSDHGSSTHYILHLYAQAIETRDRRSAVGVYIADRTRREF